MSDRILASETQAALHQLLEGAKDAQQSGHLTEALRLLEEAESRSSLDADIQRQLEMAYRLAGRELEAAAAHIAANAFESNTPVLLYNLATGYFEHGHPAAERWYRVVLQMSPEMASAHQNLAALLRLRGEWREADQHLQLAYRTQWVFSQQAEQPVARILMSCAAGLGNVPTDTLLPAERFTLIKCMVEYQPESDNSLPASDVLFNAVGDPDCKAATSPALQRFLTSLQLVILNRPERVQATRRDRLGITLAQIAYVVVPHVHRINASTPVERIVEMLAQPMQTGSLIMRCAESHGGDSVALVNDAAGLIIWLAEMRSSRAPGSIYSTQFIDSRSLDRSFRKYRVIFIGGCPYPYHLAISSDWMVHYFSAGMTEAPWKLEEERCFMEHPAASLGEAAWQALVQIGARLGLDYCGIDFTIDNGRILVFEANATMIIHREPADGPLAYKNVHIDAIVEAFEHLVIEACGGLARPRAT